jgi:hypothetical protein
LHHASAFIISLFCDQRILVTLLSVYHLSFLRSTYSRDSPQRFPWDKDWYLFRFVIDNKTVYMVCSSQLSSLVFTVLHFKQFLALASKEQHLKTS